MTSPAIVAITSLTLAAVPVGATDAPQTQRVGGEPIAELETVERDGTTLYHCGPCVVDTPLPEGYPAPTPPGAFEVKNYPSVRRAVVEGRGRGEGGMLGMNAARAFWPLFNHIQGRDIAMTAPVETDYVGMTSDERAEAWSMAFLYRRAEQGPTGEDGRVTVYDAPALTVISIGVRGELSQAQLRSRVGALETWARSSDAWRIGGDPRKLSYNGPSVPPGDRWFEVQLPVEPVEPSPADDASPSADPD